MVKVRAELAERPEETLHAKERHVVDEMERPKRAAVIDETGHEVDNHIVYEQTSGGEWEVRECVGKRESRGTVQAVCGLLLQDAAASDLNRKLERAMSIPNMHDGVVDLTSPNASRALVSIAAKITEPRVKAP